MRKTFCDICGAEVVDEARALIEYNKYKFSCELRDDQTFGLKGLRVIKRPTYRKVPQFQIDTVIANIAKRSLNEVLQIISLDIIQRIKKGIVYRTHPHTHPEPHLQVVGQ